MLEVFRTKLASSCRRLLAARTVRRFARQQGGTSAVEFGLIAAPFLALVFAIMETAVIFFSGQALETAVADSARLIMTGQAQTAGFSQSAFKDAVCAKIYGLFNCQSGIYVDVQKFSNFANVTMTKPIDANGNFLNNFTYNPGGPGDIVVVRLFYKWPVYVSLLNWDKSSNYTSGGNILLVATSAFRNEPY
jgi:Flp pilus assembly protein TadG